ncbi:MAG: DNRLRE domain-containing protein, partial [Pirellulales bacterium]
MLNGLCLETLEARLLLTTDLFPVPFDALEPAGSLIYRSAVQADIGSVDEVDRWSVDLDDGQTIAVTIETDGFLRGAAELIDPAGAVLGRATTSSPGEAGHIGAVATTSAGTYTVEVTGLDGSTGGYAVDLVLNAAVESESLGGPDNDSPSRAQDLSNSFALLGVETSERGAVVGTFPANEISLLGSAVNTAGLERNASLSSDGLQLFFSSDHPGGLGGEDLYVSTRSSVAEPFGEGINLGPGVNSDANETGPSVSSDGLTLYFGSNRSGGLGGFDIYTATRSAITDEFAGATGLGTNVNTDRSENNPEISADGLTLLFNSSRPGGFGSQDIYAAARADTAEAFESAVVLGPEVNSSESDARPALSADGLTLYFNSSRPGGFGGHDLYVASRPGTDEAFGRSANLGGIINTASHERGPAITADGVFLFFESDRPGGMGGGDLYQVRTEDPADWYQFSLDAGESASLFVTSNATEDDGRVVTFQQGREGYSGAVDTELRQATPDRDQSSAPSINVDSDEPPGTGRDAQGLLRFDGLFGNGNLQIGLQEAILSAQLELEVTNVGDTLALHGMLQAWNANDTWNSFGGNGIQADGVEATVEPVALASASALGRLTIDVTAAVQQWQQNPLLNHGLVVLPTGNNGVDFWSAEGFVPPRLVVELAPADSQVEVDLFDDAGTQLARGIGGAENLAAAIDGFIAENAGNYLARVRGPSPSAYQLIVTRDASFDREPNNGLPPDAQDITETGVVLGAIASGAVAIDVEEEPNDDGTLGASLADLELANDWSGSFLPQADGRFQAVLQGDIALGDDQDWDFFKIFASPGDRIEILLQGSGSGNGTLSDPYLRLYDNTSRQIASNDDFFGLESFIDFRGFTYSGNYYVVADSFGSNAGSYRLT